VSGPNGTAGFPSPGDEVDRHRGEAEEHGGAEAAHIEAVHRNQDVDPTDLTVKMADGRTDTLYTTQHHPFSSASRSAWVDAADLDAGEKLETEDGTLVLVARVVNYTGAKTMHDLTVDAVHTYYVIAGTTPVLVHNCNTVAVNDAGRFGDLSTGPVGDGLTSVCHSGMCWPKTFGICDVLGNRNMVTQAISPKAFKDFSPTIEKPANSGKGNAMLFRRAVQDLVNAGPFPSEEATVEEIERTQRLLEVVTAPVSDEEAQMLLVTFGPDGCFGMAWTVLHLIETAPSALVADYSQNADNYWVRLLEKRRSSRGTG
jgi:hypothetical protein